MPFGGYYAKDGSYVEDLDNPIYNEGTLDTMRRDALAREEDRKRASAVEEYWKEVARKNREIEEIAESHRRAEKWKEEQRQRERSEQLKELRRKENMLNHWLNKNAFKRLVNKVNGKSRKFKAATSKMNQEIDIDKKNDMMDRMIRNIGGEKFIEEKGKYLNM